MLVRMRLKNFRRFKDETIEFNDGISYIEGANNAGKTTLFMAIEYALFGTVTGFRSQSSLIQPNQKRVGVELIYRGKNGDLYKLQRMHEQTGRSAKGHYTLKHIIEGHEEYMISSDFEKASEEELQLQVFETLGISKRLFDVAINIRQGEISSILEGDKHLDIVLGVSAAVMAQKQLNSVALGFEKETSQYPTLVASLNGFKNELKELQKQEINLEHEIETISDKKKKLENQIEELEKHQNQLTPVLKSYEEFKENCNLWDRSFEKLKDQKNRLSKLIKETGEAEKISEKQVQMKEKLNSLEKEADKARKLKEKFHEELRKMDQNLGDLKGKISRRKNLPQGEATCEDCGAIIDQKRVNEELIQWNEEMKALEVNIDNKREEIKEISEQIDNNLQAIKEISINISNLKASLKQLNAVKTELSELMNNLDTHNEQLLESAVNIYEKLQDYNDLQNDENKIAIPKPDLLILESDIELDPDVIAARSMISVYTEKLELEKQKLQEKTNELNIELRVTKGQLEDKEKQKQNLKPRIETVNKEIARTQSSLELLEKKKTAAERMRISANVFKSLQTELRDKAASTLASKTLKLHEKLAKTSEYSDLSVDPKNYRIYVKPKDIGEEVPAHSYQGGGHKLLLGIAFKLAIINLVTKPPFILLDEPTYGLDRGHKSMLFDKIGEITDSQLLLITHQRMEEEVSGKLFNVEKDGVFSSVTEVQTNE